MLENIKSSFILKVIFNVLTERKKLEILRYNKKFQNRIYLSIVDYKKYLQIEIDLILKDELNDYDIYYINKHFQNKPFVHIYFYYKEAERKILFITKNENITKIKVVVDKELKSFKSFFQNCSFIKEIIFNRFYKTDITDMSCMNK